MMNREKRLQELHGPTRCHPPSHENAFPLPVVKSVFLPVSVKFGKFDESDRLRVVLVAARNPPNIGAAARAMSNFGFHRLRVVVPYEKAFREARSAVGASRLLANAEEYKTVADAVADCTLVVGTTAG